MKKFIAWLVLSSKDPEKVSLTIKGVIATAATYIIFFTSLFHLNFSATDLATVGDLIGKIVQALLMVVSLVTTLIGFVRKLTTTANGTNEVINTGKTL